MPTPPPWEGMHVIVVHFPIALLFVAPLFVLLGAVTGLRSMMFSALILMVLGVIGAFVATNTGEAAMDMMDDFPFEDAKYDIAYEVLEAHEENAEYARNLFAGGTVLYAVVLAATLLVPAFKKYVPRFLLHVVFAAIWAYPVLVLAEAAHEGGRLVHEFEVRSVLAETADGEPDYEAILAEQEAAEEAAEQADEDGEEADGDEEDGDQGAVEETEESDSEALEPAA